MSKREHEAALDAELNGTGPQMLDWLGGELPIRSLLGPYARPDGLVRALVQGTLGEEFDSLQPFVPGIDDGTNLDIPATFTDGKPQARRMIDQGSPNVLHVILDMPERFQAATGDYRPQSIETFTLALCGHIATAVGAGIKVYRNDGERAGLMFEGPATDTFSAFNQLTRRVKRNDIQSTDDTSLHGLLKLARSHIDPQENVAVIASDFLDGYQPTTGRFDWEGPLDIMGREMGDRVRAVRILSPAQIEMPLGVSDLLSLGGISDINSGFAKTASAKDERILTVLKDIAAQEIDTFRGDHTQNPHPVRALTKFIVGTTVE